ncbi:uncharacterized protein LOC130941773 isoform X2 [Arachis stenosperma]|uniref:uncharacterized protein LOC130941773 isoform X2 n=1 Tax=Arachis stenosperma TaxID=217475 RepID=UPI0025AC6A6B|nr:uncharacterized protein LOC130941773 isoform X2 [Arachis stenosperma]
MAREKDKKTAVEEKKNNPYHWVHDDVKTRSSSYVDSASLHEFEGLKIVKEGSGIGVELLPCLSEDRVFERRGDWEHFYMYTPYLLELGVKFPFYAFECDVLTQLNCAPSQLHPNSWVFLRAFECLIEFLSFPCSLSLFFSLFQSKGVRRGQWVYLSSFPGCSLFLLYKSSFKNFKSLFVKVRSKEAEYPFYLDDELIERFPLYWCSEPCQILEAIERSVDEECLLEFLIKCFADGVCLSIPELLRLHDAGDSEGLRSYIGGRAPLLDPSKFQSFLKKKKEKDARVSGVVKEAGGEAAQSAAQPTSSFKRKRVETDQSLEVISEGEKDDAGSGRSVFDRQRWLHGFIPGTNTHSLWSNQFPIAELSDRVSQYPGDMLMTRRIGMEGIGKFIQIVASRLMCVGRTTELVGAEHQVTAGRVAELEKLLKEKDVAIERVLKERDEVATKMKSSEDEVTRLRDQIRLLQSEIKDSDLAKGQLTSRVHELEELGMEMFASSFNRAVSQIAALALEFDCARLDVTKNRD